MSKRQKSAFKKITNNLGQLSRTELEELKVIVEALLEATESNDLQEPKEVSLSTPKEKEDLMALSYQQAKAGLKPKKGHIEEKIIRGYGPYLYLRFWKEGSLKSLYIGKKGGS